MIAKTSFAEVHGVRVHYLKCGSGPPLVMVHGLIATASSWEQLFPALSTVRTVYALDMPNMGESGRAVIDAGLAATADWLAGFLDAVGIARTDIAGSSHGGAVSLTFAARHRQRVGRMILFSPANPFCRQAVPLISFYNTWLGTAAARTIPYLPRAVHDWAHRRVYGDPSKATASALAGYTAGLNRQSIDHVLGIVRLWWSDMEELRGRLADIRGVPALLIWGGADAVVTRRSGEQLRDAIGAEMMTMPGVGHLPFAEAPEECGRLVLDWLSDKSGS